MARTAKRSRRSRTNSEDRNTRLVRVYFQAYEETGNRREALEAVAARMRPHEDPEAIVAYAEQKVLPGLTERLKRTKLGRVAGCPARTPMGRGRVCRGSKPDAVMVSGEEGWILTLEAEEFVSLNPATALSWYESAKYGNR